MPSPRYGTEAQRRATCCPDARAGGELDDVAEAVGLEDAVGEELHRAQQLGRRSAEEVELRRLNISGCYKLGDGFQRALFYLKPHVELYNNPNENAGYASAQVR